MTKLSDITRKVTAAYNTWYQQGRGGSMPSWSEIIKTEFAKFAASQNQSFKFAGPFGLRSSFLVTIGRKTREFELHDTQPCHLGRRNYRKVVEKFKPGTIGAMNQMGFACEVIPGSTPLSQLFV